MSKYPIKTDNNQMISRSTGIISAPHIRYRDDLLQRYLNLMKFLVLRATECTAILILIIMYSRGQPVLSAIALIGVCIDKPRLVMDSCLLLCRKSKYSILRWLEVVISSLKSMSLAKPLKLDTPLFLYYEFLLVLYYSIIMNY